ncbi:MAG: PIG-L family deacetylase [Candidatus Levybacteria bacterium]|nr:PIG-L family deacetylase [Candidatus Levybacteria bacterium]
MASKEVLAIGGHPDDMEQFAGGTLILLKKAGYGITIAALTDGACGSKTVSHDEIVNIRLKEAEKAAKMLGANYINLGIRDGSVEYTLENVRKLVKLIREVNPEIIITHPAKDDYMTDHWHTGALVLWAVPEAGHPNFDALTNAPAIESMPYVYHTDPQGLTNSDGQIVRVNTIVDTSEVIEEKLAAFATHESQVGFLSHKKKRNAVDKTRRWAVTRGEQVRVDYGEGFNQQLNAEYPRNNILFEMLPRKVFTL